jgi:flagellar hook-basal body complex protein FliE
MSYNALNGIQAYSNVAKQASGGGLEARDQVDVSGFRKLVADGIKDTISAQRTSEAMSAKAVAGQADLTQVVQAIDEAEASLNMFMAVRDRLISAYEEIQRMAI